MLREKGPHNPDFAHDIVCIYSVETLGDLIQYNIVGNAEVPLLRSFPFNSELNATDIVITGKYMNYQIFSKLHFRPLLKNFFIFLTLIWEPRKAEKKFVSVISFLLLWCVESLQPSILT